VTRQAEQVEQTRRADADARVLRAVRAAPGATTYRLRVTCRLNDAGARHALNRLEEAGLVRRDQKPGNSRTGFISHWYAEDIDRRERRRREQMRAQNTGTLAGSVGQLVPSTGQQQDTVRQLVGKYATGPEDQALLLEVLGL
jgi:predicted transcriptional regulator